MKNKHDQYLELKNAELEQQLAAKTRDLEIEASLERVRARTMAMQKSEELSETAFILFQQFKELGENPDQATIGIINEEEHVIEYWVTMYGSQINKVFEFSIDEPNVTNRIYIAWKKQQKSLVIDLSGKELDDFTIYRAKMGGAVRKKTEKRRVINVAFFAKGLINVQSTESRSEESIRLLEKFAGVFDGTYTRFLDLQKAEAQAREAQIELALERVRARTMAMYHSEELAETAAVLFEQLSELGNEPARIAIWILDQEKDFVNFWATDQDGDQINISFKARISEQTSISKMYAGWKEKSKSLSIDLQGEELAAWVSFCREEMGIIMRDDLLKKRRVHTVGYFSQGWINYTTHDPLSGETIKILERFSAVFDHTYTRFLDLQKAEAQAKESQIQLALERVRARTMAMQKSEELHEVIQLVFDQLQQLNFNIDVANFALNYKETDDFDLLLAVPQGKYPMEIHVPYFKHPVFDRFNKAKKKGNLLIDMLTKDEKDSFFEHFFKYAPGVSEETKASIFGRPGFVRSSVLMRITALTIHNYDGIPYSEAENNTLLRFGQVFEQTYTRFKDLKHAEEQARESQIQLALERVRARTMAMQKSDELAETATVLFQQLHNLDINSERTFIGMPNDDTRKIELWGTEQGGNQMSTRFEYEADATYAFSEIYKAWQEKRSELTVILKGKNLAEHVNYVRNVLHMPLLAQLVQKQRILYNAFFSKGLLMIVTPDTQSKETLEILERFAGVFDGTYTRFLDLQRAEEQAREAQIELSLERVRAKTMAMHTSEHVGETVATMFDELVKLGIEKTVRCGILIIDETKHMEVWTAAYNTNGKVDMMIGRIDMMIHPITSGIHQAWKNKEQIKSYELRGEDLIAYYRAVNNSPEYPVQFDLASLPAKQTNNAFFFPEGAIFAFTLEPLSADAIKLFKRFAGVFGLTYRRFLDLKKAEDAAHEAQIEAALERVRGKAMAMRSSGDLNDTANTVFIELRKLGVDLVRCGLGLMEKESHISTIHAATNSAEGGSLEVLGNIDMNIHPVLEGIYNQWRQNKDYFPVLQEESLRTYYEALHKSGISVPGWKSGEKQYGYFLQFAYGSLYAWSGKQESELTIKTLKRFTSVIGLTYTRYIELQKAESNTKEAIKQASLDRVRAEIASMRKRSDLERITPLIWDELTILGIPFIRCGVFIMDEEQKLIHTFLSTPDGKAIGAFHVPFDTSGNFEIMVDSWRHKEPYIDHWKEKAFSQFADALVKQRAISSKAQYMRTLPHEGVHLNFLPFLQGMLYVGNIEPLAEDNIDLIQAVADAFSTAYARYEDFNKLEAAKQQVDNTLIDLKAAQTKLIQSEKMASLGELTAGIAHEIQNPLNFVNNFSEVNQEMIDELEEELKAGNIEEALAIAADIKQNEEKISHHGKRADGIVKGMLQHSRTSSGEKQLTNMNVLADEFLRLSYHGLRAKDKTFNAEMVTHFDPELPKISVIAQDMGRVMLNLFNNAFYAVNQKKKTAMPDYKPEVLVTTFTENGQLIIKVKDNGVGMSEHVKEKIMQPFFTTKPTGEGTGLGLSLTYDMVVKGHGGKIDVNTKEGEYTEFIISLLLN